MKARKGFVSNSSSTIFVIMNKTNSVVDLVQFVKESAKVIENFNRDYDYAYTVEDLLKVADSKNITWKPGEQKRCEFGDHDGDYGHTVLGLVYDYSLREGGESKSFIWKFFRHNR